MRLSLFFGLFLKLLTFTVCGMIVSPSVSADSLTIDDVLGTVSTDSASLNPQSSLIAVSIQRPVGSGEVFGRNSYEIDTSRNDIWLLDRDRGQSRRLTSGAQDGAGYWCQYWSPDGTRLAMLSTKPENGEPYGGDNVRLYLWGSNVNELSRVSDRAVLAQTRYGSPINPLDMRIGGTSNTHACRSGDENAPFLWLDNRRILVILTEPGRNSPMIERYSLPAKEAFAAMETARRGGTPTVSISDTRENVRLSVSAEYQAELAVVDVDSGTTTTIAQVPAFPFRGTLSVLVDPDRKKVAILAPSAAIAPSELLANTSTLGDWRVHKRVGVFDLHADEEGKWVPLPKAAQYPVDLLSWSPDGSSFLIRARPTASDISAGFWLVDTVRGSVIEPDPRLVSDVQLPAQFANAQEAIWPSSESVLVRGRHSSNSKQDRSWYLIALTRPDAPTSTRPTGISSDLWMHPNGAVFEGNPGELRLLSPELLSTVQIDAVGDRLPCTGQLRPFEKSSETGRQIAKFSSDRGSINWIDIPSSVRILAADCHGAILENKSKEGTTISHLPWEGDVRPIALLELNSHLSNVAWGERKIVNYSDGNGQTRSAAVIFPPDYDETRPYPTLFWLYGGYVVRGLDGFFLDRYQSGFYNLELYAAQGYVVVIPSMPLDRSPGADGPLQQLEVGVVPAIDELVRLGIADENRIGVFGQSFGGFSVAGLISQTDRFAAAVAIASITDQSSNHSSFDPTARGYPGIEQDMSENSIITEQFVGLNRPPWEVPDRYKANSPITFVENIKTPLLLVHGELDIRANLAQPEMLFMQLYQQGKEARLLRYWGENHSLANSPANVRSIFAESIDWFDHFLKREADE